MCEQTIRRFRLPGPAPKAQTLKAETMKLCQIWAGTALPREAAREDRTQAAWLARIGCSGTDLECGSHAPYQEASVEALIRAGRKPDARSAQ